jgi:hypothetical protein
LITSVVGSTGYEGSVLNTTDGRLTSVSGIWNVVSTIYSTAYVGNANTVILFAALLVCLIGPTAALQQVSRAVVHRCVVVIICVAALPLVALPYAVNPAFLADPERVGFPISVGFVLLCFTVLSRCSKAESDIGVLQAGALVLALLATTTLGAMHDFRDYEIQRTVLVQSGALAANAGASSILLRDQTGILGDVYTLYPPTLTIALRARGHAIEAVLCTPTGVDRVHPVARRLGIPTTPRCEELPPPSSGSLVLDATGDAHHIAVAATTTTP